MHYTQIKYKLGKKRNSPNNRTQMSRHEHEESIKYLIQRKIVPIKDNKNVRKAIFCDDT